MKKLFLGMILAVTMLLSVPFAAYAADEIKVFINGEKITFEVPPKQNAEGTTLVPMRAIFEALGANVQWDGVKKTITGTKNSTIMHLELNRYEGMVNSTIVWFSEPVKQEKGRIMVPLRFVSESFNCTVNWDEETKTIRIKSVEDKIYGVGETAPIMIDGVNIGTLTINSVTTTSEHTYILDKEPAQIIVVDYTYTNAQTEEMYVSDSNFKVLDEGSNICSTYFVMSLDFPKSAPQGAKCTAQAAFGTIETSKKITLIYQPEFSSNTYNIKFVLPVE